MRDRLSRSNIAPSSGRLTISGLAWIFCCWFCLPDLWVCGQTDQDAAGNLPVQLRDGLIQPQQRVWIPGNDGRPLMQITLEELRELERVYREATQLPAILESTSLQVYVEKSHARVAVDFTAEVRGAKAVERFELGLKTCQLVQQPAFQSIETDSESVQQRVFPSQDGYQWLILAERPGQHKVSLEAKTVLEQSSDRTNLSLDLPFANTAFEIFLPPGATEVRLRSEDILVERNDEDSAVRLLIQSRGGAFTISWRESLTTGPLGMVEAKSDTVYEPYDVLDSSQIWSATTTLNIRWFGGDGGNQVQVALPPGGQWSSLPYSEFDRFRLTTSVITEEEGSTTADPGTETSGSGTLGSSEVLIIENLDPAEFPSVEDLSLQWRWSPAEIPSDRSVATFSVPSPEITGVDSHEGVISLIFPSIYRFSYQEGPGVRFLDQGRVADLGLGRHQAQFAFQQPVASVNVSFRHESQLPSANTVHRVHVSEGRLDLTTWIRCWFEGGPMELGFFPGDWTLDEASAVTLRDASLPLTSASDPLLLRPRGGNGVTLGVRELESSGSKQPIEQIWRLKSSRKWNSEDAGEVQFSLPALDRSNTREDAVIGVGSGVLLITSDKSLIVHQAGDAGDMESDTWVESYSPEYLQYCAIGSRRPLAFRFHQQGEPLDWTGQVRVMPQHLAIRQNVELEISEKQIGIEQRFDFRIANRPLNRLTLLVHRDALPLEANIGDFLLPYEIVSSSNNDGSSPADEQWKQVELIGLPDLIGSSQLTIRSAVDWGSSATRSSQPDGAEAADPPSLGGQPMRISVPLVQLQNLNADSPGRTLGRLKSDVRWDVRMDESVSDGKAASAVSGSVFELAERQRLVELIVQERVPIGESAVTTNGVWLQTVLSGSERRDRFVARVRSRENQIAIQLPEQSRVESVALNGVQLGNDEAPFDYNSNQVAVSLPNENEHVVEVVYLLSESLTWAHRFHTVPARVLGASLQERFYWQLVTPGIYHLGWCPAPLTAEWQWRWSSFGLARSSPLDQGSLESWIGAATLTRIPISANSYVMSGLNEFPPVEVWIFSRFALWFPMGVVAILLAVGILNSPWLRTPNCFIIAALLTAIAAAIWPDMSMLIGQTALATLVLVALIFLTQAAVQSRVNRRSIFSSQFQSRREPSDAFTASRGRLSSVSRATPKVTSLESTGAE